MQVVVCGFVLNGPGSYLRSPWNVLDFAIILIGEPALLPLLLAASWTPSLCFALSDMYTRVVLCLGHCRHGGHGHNPLGHAA